VMVTAIRRMAVGVFGAAALAICAGCATGTAGTDEAAVLGAATAGDCRGGGVYNRAAGMCVGGGGI
jgi:hypothetical protein